MKLLYLDLYTGISGDMTLGALLDAGASREVLERELAKLNLGDEFTLAVKRMPKAGIMGTDVDVILTELDEETLHQKQHELGLDHGHGHAHPQEEEIHRLFHGEPHEGHHHSRGGEAHTHGEGATHIHRPGLRRNMQHIVSLIRNSALNDRVKEHSISVFTLLAEAEASVHGTTVEEIHFHEVGAVDAIVDIVGSCILFDDLNPGRILASPVHVGSGTVRIEHGTVPVPAPATMKLLAGKPIYSGQVQGELVTPTGAALLAHFVKEFGSMPPMMAEAIGYGHGKRNTGGPNSLRVVIGEEGNAG